MAAPSSGNSEYVELYNTNDFAVDLTGAQIDDIVGGSNPYTIESDNALILARGHLLYTRNFGQNNSGDSVRLIAADGSVVDIHSYLENPGTGIAWSRYPDGGDWRNDLPQSPGQTNPQPPTSTATATVTPTATFTPTPTLTPTPQPQASATHTPTPTPTPIPDGVRINEYLAAPASGESEYVELFNSNPFDVDLSDWQIDDVAGSSSPYSIPLDTFIPAQGFYLALRDLGLNNSGDTVRLIAPDGYVELFNHQSLSRFTFLYHTNEHLCYSVSND